MTIDEYNTLENRFKELRKEFEDARSNMGQTVFKDTVSKWFAKHPEFKMVFWTQYTPYFNDGDSCTFSVHEANFYLGGDESKTSLTDEEVEALCEMEDVRFPNDEQKAAFLEKLKTGLSISEARSLGKYQFEELCVSSYSSKATVAQKAAMKEFEALLDEDLLLALFGDHVIVYINPEEIRVEEYNHD